MNISNFIRNKFIILSEISLLNLLVSIPKILKYVNETKKIKINDTKNIFNIFIILTK